jgi:hypothetical protein
MASVRRAHQWLRAHSRGGVLAVLVTAVPSVLVCGDILFESHVAPLGWWLATGPVPPEMGVGTALYRWLLDSVLELTALATGMAVFLVLSLSLSRRQQVVVAALVVASWVCTNHVNAVLRSCWGVVPLDVLRGLR